MYMKYRHAKYSAKAYYSRDKGRHGRQAKYFFKKRNKCFHMLLLQNIRVSESLNNRGGRLFLGVQEIDRLVYILQIMGV